MDDDLKIETAAMNVVAQVTSRFSFAHRKGHASNRFGNFTTNVNDRMRGANREGRNDDALNECMWVSDHDGNVFACTGF